MTVQTDHDAVMAELRRLRAELETSTRKRSLSELQRVVAEWRARNFPKQQRLEPVVGLAEETGEAWTAVLALLYLGHLSAAVGRVSHAALKSEQGIRGTPEQLREKLADAIGDLLIFAINVCNLFELDLEDVVDRTWETVSKRDWRADPANGGAR